MSEEHNSQSSTERVGESVEEKTHDVRNRGIIQEEQQLSPEKRALLVEDCTPKYYKGYKRPI